jgi:hypothetical protein
MESPGPVSAAAHDVLSELSGFREFLARADADRLNRENSPGRTPEVLEKFTAYAVALDVERGWGEELAENLLELLQFDQVYGRRVAPSPVVQHRPREPRTYPPHNGFIELGISARKTSD